MSNLVELIDATDAVVREHERSGLDRELSGLLIARDGRRETRGAARLAGRVDGAREESAHVLEELRLGRRRIADDAHVDVATKVCAIGGFLHEKKAKTS